MALSDPGFLLLFAGIFAVWHLMGRFGAGRWRWLALLASNLLFYALGATPTLWYSLAAATLAAFAAALAMDATENKALRRLALAAGLAVMLGFLIAFKYLGFFTGGLLEIGLAQPIGISFYTLQTTGYLIDVYRGRIRAERHLGYFAASVSFFAILTSGPITRPERLTAQLREASQRRDFNLENTSRGLVCFLFGLFEKRALADLLASLCGVVASEPGTVLDTSLLIGCLLYSLNIYFDFAGYSNMALGLGRMLGIELEQNFRRPYFALTARDFWSRWHLSLSHWLRDYVYIPLGGSRRGTARTLINLMLTFLVSGLWHGAGVCFLIWGALHGLYQVVGRLTGPARERAWRRLGVSQQNPLLRLWKMAFTFALVTFAWLFFHVGTAGGDAATAFEIIRRIFSGFTLSPRAWLDGCALLELHPEEAIRLAGLLAAAFGLDFLGRRSSPEDWILARPAPVRTIICWGLVAAVLLLGRESQNFIYFAF